MGGMKLVVRCAYISTLDNLPKRGYYAATHLPCFQTLFCFRSKTGSKTDALDCRSFLAQHGLYAIEVPPTTATENEALEATAAALLERRKGKGSKGFVGRTGLPLSPVPTPAPSYTQLEPPRHVTTTVAAQARSAPNKSNGCKPTLWGRVLGMTRKLRNLKALVSGGGGASPGGHKADSNIPSPAAPAAGLDTESSSAAAAHVGGKAAAAAVDVIKSSPPPPPSSPSAATTAHPMLAQPATRPPRAPQPVVAVVQPALQPALQPAPQPAVAAVQPTLQPALQPAPQPAAAATQQTSPQQQTAVSGPAPVVAAAVLAPTAALSAAVRTISYAGLFRGPKTLQEQVHMMEQQAKRRKASIMAKAKAKKAKGEPASAAVHAPPPASAAVHASAPVLPTACPTTATVPAPPPTSAAISASAPAPPTAVRAVPPAASVIPSGLFQGSLTLQEQLHRMEQQAKKRKRRPSKSKAKEAKATAASAEAPLPANASPIASHISATVPAPPPAPAAVPALAPAPPSASPTAATVSAPAPPAPAVRASTPSPSVIPSGLFQGSLTLQEQLRRMEQQAEKRKLRLEKAKAKEAKAAAAAAAANIDT